MQPNSTRWCCLCTIGPYQPQKNAALLMPSACWENCKGCGLSKGDSVKCTGLPEFPGCVPMCCNLLIEKPDLLDPPPIHCPISQLALRISSELCSRSFAAECGILVVVPCRLWCSSLPQQCFICDRLSSQVAIHLAPGSRPFRGKKTGTFLRLFEENSRRYPLFSIRKLKRLSSLSTQTVLLRRRTLNPLARTVVKFDLGRDRSQRCSRIPHALCAPPANHRLSSRPARDARSLRASSLEPPLVSQLSGNRLQESLHTGPRRHLQPRFGPDRRSNPLRQRVPR